jgi:hypothetical protein
MLRTIGDAILAELDNIMRAFVTRVLSDDAMPTARGTDPAVVEDHLATFLADVAVTVSTVTVDAEEPTQEVRDGSAIQRVVSQRHGAQRARLGWPEHEVRREFVILEEELNAGVQRRLPQYAIGPSHESGVGEAGRAGIFLHQAMHIAEGISLESYRAYRARE